MAKRGEKALQKTSSKKLVVVTTKDRDSLAVWMAAFLEFEDGSVERSRKEKRRDFDLFLEWMAGSLGHDRCDHWIPRVSQNFKEYLLSEKKADQSRRFADATIKRIMAS